MADFSVRQWSDFTMISRRGILILVMKIKNLLLRIESTIPTESERAYFWTHEARYEKILEQIAGIIGTIPQDSGNRVRILDVGCFPYHIGAAMEHMGLDVYGISSQHEPLQGAKIKTCNIEKDTFPFKDNFFDIVIFTEVLEHLPQSPLHTIKEMYRVLSPGGHILITTPNIARSINRAKLLFGKSVTYPLHQLLEQEGKGSNIYHRHNREYTVHEVAQLTHLAGFEIDTATTFVSYTPWRRRVVPDPLWITAGKIANYALMLMIEGLRDTVLVIGRK